jgi:molecular chaperone HscA
LPAGHARLEVSFAVDENGMLKVSAKELLTSVEQHVEVTPSYGLDDEQVEAMLLDALDHGETDFEQRRLVEARVEGSRLVLATQKALAADADLLSSQERTQVERALGQLEHAIANATLASALQNAADALDAATHEWAGRRMNRAIAGALGGKAVGSVEQTVQTARGVDVQVAEHAQASAERTSGPGGVSLGEATGDTSGEAQREPASADR